MRHSRDMGSAEVTQFLTMLANERRVSVSTHNQALSALLFLYREVLGLLDGEVGLLARLLYGTGMRLMEGLRLRVKDIDFDRQVLIVRQAKGGKDRVVMLPGSLHEPLKSQVARARALWSDDRQASAAGVETPDALAVKYPDLGRRWGWFWVFPAPRESVDPRSQIKRRHHLYEERLQRAIKLASAGAQIIKPVSVHTLRHSFDSDVSTTMIYTHVLKVAAGGTASPLDALLA